MTVILANLCMSCTHKRQGKNTCTAFPLGIPEDIFLWGRDHRTPVPGDSGIVFELDTGKADLFTVWKGI